MGGHVGWVKASPFPSVIAIVDGFRVALPMLRFRSPGVWHATAMLCHGQQARVGVCVAGRSGFNRDYCNFRG